MGGQVILAKLFSPNLPYSLYQNTLSRAALLFLTNVSQKFYIACFFSMLIASVTFLGLFMLRYPIFGLCLILTGCQALSNKPVLSLNKNLLTSTSNPLISIAVTDQLTPLFEDISSGSIAFSDGFGGAYQTEYNYVFGKTENKKVLKEMLHIDFIHLNKGEWYNGFDESDSRMLDYVTLSGSRYDTSIYINSVDDNSNIYKTLITHGYVFTSCYIRKTYKKIHDRKVNLLITYSENTDCSNQKEIASNNKSNKEFEEFLAAFNKRADKSFTILNNS